jgi:hypothetical protein
MSRAATTPVDSRRSIGYPEFIVSFFASIVVAAWRLFPIKMLA